MAILTLEDRVERYSRQYHALQNDPQLATDNGMPGKAYFIDDSEVLSIPRDDGDCRYPYGREGFNFWAYTSGYMHGNEGLFSLFLRASEGQEPKIAFFAGLPEKGTGLYSRIPLLAVPRLNDEAELNICRYTVFSRCAAYYITEWADFLAAVRIFVNADHEMIFTILARNRTVKPQQIFLSSFLNPFLAHDIVENAEHRWFREVSIIRPTGSPHELPSFMIKVNEDLSRTQSLSNYGIIRRKIVLGSHCRMTGHQETASRYQYVGGIRGNLNDPSSLKNGGFGREKAVCAFTESGIAGDIIHLEIGADESGRLDTVFGYCFNAPDRERLLERPVDCDRIEGDLSRAEREELAGSHGLSMEIGPANQEWLRPRVWNAFFEHLKKQVEFCSLIKGYVQLATTSLIGIRDIFQALEGLLFWQPEVCRAKILEALGFIFPDGRCPRQYSLPPENGGSPVMDLRPFIDQGAWVIASIITYLRVTGDFGFLDESCGYYEIIDEKAKTVRKSNIQDNVLGHMLRIMDYLISNLDSKTHCLHALYGDWNDALDGLGVSYDPEREYGSGVSVMASLQVYQNLLEMMELLQKIDPEEHAARISRYRATLNSLQAGLLEYAVITNGPQQRIVHGWGDDRRYLVGSFNDPDNQARDSLTANAFWVLSKLYDIDPGIKPAILSAFERLDSKYGLRTFVPHFEMNTPGVGRITKLPPGTAENGAAYIHASAFGIMALFRMGCPEKAWEQLRKSLPFTHQTISGSPFVMPNSYGLNEEKLIDGESMADWQTGSSNVILKTLIRFVFGIEPQFDGVWIQPAVWMPFNSFRFRIMIRTTSLSIRYQNQGGKRRTYRVNGENRGTVYDEVMRLEKLWLANGEFRGTELNIEVIDSSDSDITESHPKR